MPYKRKIFPDEKISSYKDLTADMAGIGMNFDVAPNHEANIENTIISASFDGMEKSDYRTLSVLCVWIDGYYPLLNIDRLAKLASAVNSDRVRAFWTAVGMWKKTDSRSKKLSTIYEGSRVEVHHGNTSYWFQKHGEDKRFEGTTIRTPANTLRKRKSDALPISLMAKKNKFIKYRVLIGPTYKSDMWAMQDLHPEITAYELARRTYGSFPTAWKVKKDWQILNGGALVEGRQGV